VAALIAAIGRVKILDPACGSGAFPMGALHRLVDLLQKLDPNNESWKRDRLTEVERDYEILREANASSEELAQCEARIQDIRRSFDSRFHALDFARKLYLIENCIYGVDVQPIATQIAKLRFFISLIVDQYVNLTAPNLGVRPLPNLETKIVAADVLIPIEKADGQLDLLDLDVRPLRRTLERVRHDHFNARTPAAKARYRDKDATLRTQIAELLRRSGMPAENARHLAAWDPYNQNYAANFFDSEWMFGVPIGTISRDGASPGTFLEKFALINELPGQMELVPSLQMESGFDIVLGNPPYVRQEQIRLLKPRLREAFSCFVGTADLYVYFYELSIRLLRRGGVLSFITSNKWLRAGYGERLRAWMLENTRIRLFQSRAATSAPRDSLMLGYFEQLLNGLVYELYFPDELHAQGLHLFDLIAKIETPQWEAIREPERLARLRQYFERIYDTNHPLRGALHTLRSLETVRTIEGEA
jgi:adenine-specific DNA-methyltransferase